MKFNLLRIVLISTLFFGVSIKELPADTTVESVNLCRDFLAKVAHDSRFIELMTARKKLVEARIKLERYTDIVTRLLNESDQGSGAYPVHTDFWLSRVIERIANLFHQLVDQSKSANTKEGARVRLEKETSDLRKMTEQYTTLESDLLKSLMAEYHELGIVLNLVMRKWEAISPLSNDIRSNLPHLNEVVNGFEDLLIEFFRINESTPPSEVSNFISPMSMPTAERDWIFKRQVFFALRAKMENILSQRRSEISAELEKP